MSTINQNEISEVFGRVKHWPTEARQTLLEMIQGTLEPNLDRWKPKGTLKDLVGLLKSDGPPPTDNEIAQVLHERRMSRFGP